MDAQVDRIIALIDRLEELADVRSLTEAFRGGAEAAPRRRRPAAQRSG
jgi:hypothetical protein